MKKYYTLNLFEKDIKGMKWGLWFDENEPVEVIFNQANEFVGFRLKEHAESYDPNWEVGEWEDYTIRGVYPN